MLNRRTMPRGSRVLTNRQGTLSISPVQFITAFKVREKFEAGVRLLQSGDVLAAIQQFQEASFFDTEDALSIVALAECYIFLCDLRSAIRCYRRALWSLRKSEKRQQQQRPVSRGKSLHDSSNNRSSVVSITHSLEAPPLHPDPLSSSSSATTQEPAQVNEVLPPPQRPTTAQFPPSTLFLSSELLHAVEHGGLVASDISPEATNAEAIVSTAAKAETKEGEERRPSRSSHGSGVSPSMEGKSLSMLSEYHTEASNSNINASVTSATSQTYVSSHELTAEDVRARLAGVLDALGLALFQVGSVEQALRCTTEALELLAVAEIHQTKKMEASYAWEGDLQSGNFAKPATPRLFPKLPNPYLSDSIIALHRAVFLIALQREEEAEVLLSSHYEMFEDCRAQSAPLLIQLYCNRQAFRKARMLLESQEERLQSALSSGTTAAVLPSDDKRAVAVTKDKSTGDPSYFSRPIQRVVEGDGNGNAEEVATTAVVVSPVTGEEQQQTGVPAAAPLLSASKSLTVAKYIFTEMYARYRSAALVSDDENSVTRCLDVYPNDVDLLFRRAQLRIAAGELKRSVKDLFRCVQETNGEHKAAIETMTTVLFTIGASLDGEAEVQNAITYYSESLKWRPDNLLVLLARGDCYTKTEAYEDALADYQAVLNYAPGHREAQGRIAALHDLWGRKLFALDNAVQAEAEFTNAIKTDSTNPEFYYHRALCRLKLNQGRYALRDVLSCRELNPSAPHLREFIARYMEPIQSSDGAASMEKSAARRALNNNSVSVDGHRQTPAGSRSSAAAKWYGARTPPPPPLVNGHKSRGGGDFHSKRGGDPSSYSTSWLPSSRSASVTLPPISTRSTPSPPALPRTAAAEEWVQGCQTVLHRRQGETLSQTK